MNKVIKRGDSSYKIKFGYESFTRITVLDEKDGICLCCIKHKEYSAFNRSSVKKLSRKNIRFISKEMIDELDIFSRIKDFSIIHDEKRNYFLRLKEDFIEKLKKSISYIGVKVSERIYNCNYIYFKDPNNLFKYKEKNNMYNIHIGISKDYKKIEKISDNYFVEIEGKFIELEAEKNNIFHFDDEEYKFVCVVNSMLLFKNISKEYSWITKNTNKEESLEFTGLDNAIEVKLKTNGIKDIDLLLQTKLIKKDNLLMVSVIANSNKDLYLKIETRDDKVCYYYYNKKLNEGWFLNNPKKAKFDLRIKKEKGNFYLQSSSFPRSFRTQKKGTQVNYGILTKGKLYNFYTQHETTAQYQESKNSDPLVNLYTGELRYKNKNFYPLGLEKDLFIDLEKIENKYLSVAKDLFYTFETHEPNFFWLATYKNLNGDKKFLVELIDFKKGETVFYHYNDQESVGWPKRLAQCLIERLNLEINFNKLKEMTTSRKKNLIKLKMELI